MNIDVFSIIFLQSFRNTFFDFLAISLAYIFSTTVLSIFSLFLLCVSIIKKYTKAFLIFFSFVVLAAITTVLKYGTARPRPEYAISLPMLPYSEYSFPSGHTAAAFLFAVILSRYYPKYKYAFFGIAILTGISRLYLGLHYLSDVIASIVIGTVLGIIILKYEKEIFQLSEKIIKLVRYS